MEVLRKSFLFTIDNNKILQKEVIAFYNLPNTITDTASKFKLKICEVKYILELNNVQEHSKELVKKITNKKRIQTSLAKYGVESPNQLKEVKEKKKKVYQEKYGVDSPVQLDKAKINRKIVCEENKDEIKEKRQQTCLKRYGVKEAIGSKQIRDKIKQTNLQKYGIENPLQSSVVQDKCRNTCLERYGVLSPAQSIEIQEKMKKTSLERYGVEYYTQTEEYKQRVKSKQEEKISKLREYFRLTYGVDWITQSKDFIDKCNKSKHKNNSFNSSKPEEEVRELLISIFGKDDVKYQYKESRYPFECDFYIKSKDLFIECNFHWTHMFHPFNKDDEDDISKLNILKEKAKTSKFYENAIQVWTIRDVHKRNYANKNNLNYIMFYNEDDVEKFLSVYDK